ncbi:hypothetical protein CHS0354_006335 [Potamilus streckersoni]|uniref:YqaJ viral recombinase domain-containing protein n=1 Tax=Potamilus streckersoni TaxID=2493646 RepID=A0AAE0S3B1_9BIVA|nr:hypothetical protein CHS0354_006335 [Potamilus streckersoni]
MTNVIKCLKMNLSNIVKICSKTFMLLQNRQAMQRGSLKDKQSKDWHRLRTGRITASLMKAVCTSSIDKPSISTIRDMCYPVRFSNKATRWGCQHEKDALNAYRSKLGPIHDTLTVVECGLIINPECPHIGASPDALVSCNCCGEGTVEVKCPYCIRDTGIQNENVSYLDKDNRLKTSHKYYYQVQTQIFLSEKKYCDFVIWTNKDISVERILPNPELWQDIKTKSTFFVHVILPELTGKLFTRPQFANNEPNMQMEGQLHASVLLPSHIKNDGQTVSGNNSDLICLCALI